MGELYNEITPLQRMLIIIAVMTATLMQVLDTTIVNVALPYMQGSLAASPDQITWTLTSYLVASAIFIPLSGYMSDRLGRKNYMLLSILGFTIASALCGASTNLTEIVIFRLLQGVFGAALVPLAQAIISDIFPAEQRGKAMAIWGFGVMAGPILGPTLGGYLTEVASWRWTFYVNVPFGIFALILAWQVLPDSLRKPRLMDWLGLSFISLAIGSLQYFLDRGNDQNWFDAWDIRISALLCIFGFGAFIIHSLFKPARIVFDLRIFQDRNFTIASLLIGLMGLGMYGVMAIQPLMLEGIMNYPVLLTGLVMAPRGISGMLGMVFMGKFGQRFDPRHLLLMGIIFNIIGIYAYTRLSLNITPLDIVWPMLLQGFGISMIFTSLSTIAFSTLPKELGIEGAGMFSLLRTIGSSVGISLVVAVYTHEAQASWNQLGGFINPYNHAVTYYLANLNLSLGQPLAAPILGLALNTQSQMLAFVDTFVFIMWSFIIMLPLILLIRKSALNQALPKQEPGH